MDAEIKEKLIDLVRKHKCLFDTKEKNYKNAQYKTLLWENIGRTLNIEGEIAKKLWRTLRDGYMRYKRLSKQQTGTARKNIQYAWSEQMSFLNSSLELRPTGSNITESFTGSEHSNDSDAPGLHSLCSPPQPSPPLLSTARPLPEPNPPVSPSLLLTPQPQVETLPSQSRQNVMTSKRKASILLQERDDKVLEYLNNKRTRRTLDGVDHLFMSYADTFKKLPLIEKTRLKVELAKLFANAKLNALGSSQQEELPVVVLSPPGYLVITQDSDFSENLVSVVEVPVDLSNNEREIPENTSPAAETGEDYQ